MVIDSTDKERLSVTREELYRMLAHEELSKASVLIFANKQVRIVVSYAAKKKVTFFKRTNQHSESKNLVFYLLKIDLQLRIFHFILLYLLIFKHIT